MFGPGDRVGVAVSGGPDSVCLLDLLFRLRDELGVELVVLHFNHGLRKTALRDQRFVEELAGSYGLELVLGSDDVRKLAEERDLGLEDAARYARYTFFERVAKDRDIKRIALGHTLSDNVETFFIRVIRGASLEGLRGILPVRDLYVRPLIEVSRSEVVEYLKGRGLLWVEDETNYQDSYLRNWVRLRLIPLLSERNPSIEETVGGILDSLRMDWELVERAVDEAEGRVHYSYKDGVLEIELDDFNRLEEPLKRHLLSRLLYRYFYPGRSGLLSRNHLEVLVAMAGNSQGSKRVCLPQGVEAVREYGRLRVGRGIWREDAVDGEVLVTSEGVYPFDDYIFVVRKGSFGNLVSAGRWCALFDPEAVKMPLIIRYRRPGDRLFIPGVGRKKLQDFFVDLKVPRSRRGRIPLVLNSRGEVLWIVGYRQREDLRPKGKEALMIEVRKVKDEGADT